MFVFYVDASFDQEKFVVSALRLPLAEWRECFDRAKQFRQDLKKQYGIYVRKELHARDFVSGRGDYSSKMLSKGLRCRIFGEILTSITALPEVEIINVCVAVPGCPVDPYLRAVERLLNRIQANLEDNQTCGLVIFDEGKEGMIRKVARQRVVFNWIPSKYGGWQTGQPRKNIAISRVLEDPIFKRSESSYFLQLVDAVAFAILKKEVAPTPRVTKYRLDTAFTALQGVFCLKASPDDPQGIERG